MGLEVVISTYRDGTIHPETWFVAFWNKEESYVRHAVGDGDHTACGESFRGKPSTGGLADPNTIGCPECRQLLADACFERKEERECEHKWREYSYGWACRDCGTPMPETRLAVAS